MVLQWNDRIWVGYQSDTLGCTMTENVEIEPGELEWGAHQERDGDEQAVSTHLGPQRRITVSTVSRSRVLVVPLVVLVAFGMLFAFSGGATADTMFTASNVDVTSHGGSLQALSIAPSGHVHYAGLESAPSAVTVDVQVKKSSASSWETVGSKSVSATGLVGNLSFDFQQIDLIQQSSLTRQDFKSSDGTTTATEVDVRLAVTFVGSGPGGSDVTSTAADSFIVNVTNIPAGAGIDGSAGTKGR